MSRTVVRILSNLNGQESVSLEKCPAVIPGGAIQYPFNAPKLPPGTPPGATGDALYQSLAIHPAVHKALDYLVQIRLGDPEVRRLYIDVMSDLSESQRWETLRDPNQGFLALSPNWPIGRITDVSQDLEKVRRFFNPPLKVLAVLAAAGMPALDEWKSLYAALTCHPTVDFRVLVLLCENELAQALRALADHRVEFAFLKDLTQFQDAVRSTVPDIIHFFCHGIVAERPLLQLATPAGWFLPEQGPDAPNTFVLLGANELLVLGAGLANTWLVLLNCCDGATAASSHSLARSLVAGGVPAVVGMQDPVDVTDASVFCGNFYDGLVRIAEQALQAGSTPLAVEWVDLLQPARNAVGNGHTGGQDAALAAAQSWPWARPVLYVRPEPFELVGAVPSATLPSPDRLQLFAQLGALRQTRSQLAGDPGTPPPLLAELDATIAALQKQLYPAAAQA